MTSDVFFLICVVLAYTLVAGYVAVQAEWRTHELWKTIHRLQDEQYKLVEENLKLQIEFHEISKNKPERSSV